MAGFLLGVLASLVAAAVAAVVTLTWRRRSTKVRAQICGRRAAKRLLTDGLSNYYGSRAEYARYRGAAQLIDYLTLAHDTVHIASYWMAHGTEMENIGRGLQKLIQSRPHLTVTISVIDPEAEFLPLLADHLDIALANVTERIRSSLDVLVAAREALPLEDQQRLTIRVSSALPVASFVMLDIDKPNGRLQLDVKPYKMPRTSSVTFEFQGRDAHLYTTLRQAGLRLLAESRPYGPQQRQRTSRRDKAVEQ